MGERAGASWCPESGSLAYRNAVESHESNHFRSGQTIIATLPSYIRIHSNPNDDKNDSIYIEYSVVLELYRTTLFIFIESLGFIRLIHCQS